MDVAQAKVIVVDKKIKKAEKKEANKREESGVIKPVIAGVEEKKEKKPISQVSMKSIKKEADKAQKAINKNEVKALKAQSEAIKLVPEVKKAK